MDTDIQHQIIRPTDPPYCVACDKKAVDSYGYSLCDKKFHDQTVSKMIVSKKFRQEKFENYLRWHLMMHIPTKTIFEIHHKVGDWIGSQDEEVTKYYGIGFDNSFGVDDSFAAERCIRATEQQIKKYITDKISAVKN